MKNVGVKGGFCVSLNALLPQTKQSAVQSEENAKARKDEAYQIAAALSSAEARERVGNLPYVKRPSFYEIFLI